MATSAEAFAVRIARECSDAAISLSRLQDRLGDQVDALQAKELMMDLQSLDSVQQTLTDLATVFDDLARSVSDDHPPVSHSVLARISQETLRARLKGTDAIRADHSIELF